MSMNLFFPRKISFKKDLQKLQPVFDPLIIVITIRTGHF